MIIIKVDFHPEFQQIAYLDGDTGELTEKRLGHREEAEQFYRTLVAKWANRRSMPNRPMTRKHGLPRIPRNFWRYASAGSSSWFRLFQLARMRLKLQSADSSSGGIVPQ